MNIKKFYVENYEQFKKAVKCDCKKLIYVLNDIYSCSVIRLNNNTKVIGLVKNNKLPVVDFSLSREQSGFILKNKCMLKNLIIQYSPDCGVRIRDNAHSNKVINCMFRYNNNSGLSITQGAYNNLIYNCYSYMNCDYKNNGKSADGFSCKLNAGKNNKFIKCISFNNSDDGFDNYDNFNDVYYIDCVAFNNGKSELFKTNTIIDDVFIEDFKGNGNGFKLASKKINNNITYRYLKNCITFNNKMKGFDQNNGCFNLTMINCKAFNNNVDYKLDKVNFIERWQ